MAEANTARTPQREQRFRVLYGTHYPHVYAYFRRRTDIESARDGTAETFLVAWRRLDDVPDSEHALAWLYGVARRVLANQWRSRRRLDRLRDKLIRLGPDPDPDPGPEKIVVREGHIQDVLDAMERLRDGDREVLRLAEWEELSHQEIADIVGCKPHAVDQRIHRALHRLRRELHPEEAVIVDGAEPVEGGA